ncbi:unnamed protein product [Absidia cylindrospora]
MFSSSSETCNYYGNSSNNSNNDSLYKTDSSTLPTQERYSHDTKSGHSSASGNYLTSDSSWHHLDHNYTLGSPTPTTSPSFPLQQYSSMLTPPASTPYVLSHSTGTSTTTTLGHHSDITPSNSSGPGTPTSLPSYGYGLSHRGFFPRPKLTTTLWEDERTICFQVDANGICVARREDNDMINGTKLLNVAGMSRGKRDGILKNEKGRVVVKVGAMHLKGVWITFDRAKTLSAQFKIQDILYPLFVDNPQTFLYTHPITSPMSRLSSFRPFYPASWDRTLPSSSSSSSTNSQTHHHTHHQQQYHQHQHQQQQQQQQQHGIDPSSPSDAYHAAPSGYRPGVPPGGPPLTPQSSSSYGDRGSNELLTMDYRSGATTSDSLTDQGNSSSPSASHGTPYYNDLLNPNHRPNDDVAFYDPSTNSNRVSSPTSTTNNGSSTLLDDNHDPTPLVDSTKRSPDSLPPSSAFQSLDSTSFHHPQSLYMGTVSTSSSSTTNSRDPYLPSPLNHHHQHQQQLYLPNPASNSILNNILPSHFSPSTSDNATTNHNSEDSAPNNVASIVNGNSSPGNINPPPSSRRDSLLMNHYSRNGTQRHHPYANIATTTTTTTTPPKLSTLQDYPSLPHLYSPSHSGSAQLKKSSNSRQLQYSPSRPLVKEVNDLSIKPESDHSSRPW